MILRLAIAFLLTLAGLVPARSSTPSAPDIPEPTTQRLIVRFHPQPPEAGATTQAANGAARVARLAAERGIALAYVRPMALGAHVIALDHPVPLSEARAIAQRLAGHAEVEFVQPDRRKRAQFVPNDADLNLQSYLRDDPAAISAFSAWDVTTGSADIVVAMVDTGYRPHAGLVGRILPGYDFIADPLVANDGDGRDADATDPGDWITRTDLSSSHTFDGCDIEISSWHGTSTAGIVAANGNDGAWTAGINWSAKILPVRVLGKCFGNDADILDGIAWAAGLGVPGVPANPTPAQVINMSLGERGKCDPAYQQVISAALAHGVTRAIVASAGNDGIDLAYNTPVQLCRRDFGGRGQLHRRQSVVQQLRRDDDHQCARRRHLRRLRRHRDSLQRRPTSPRRATVSTSATGTSFAAPMVSGVVSLMLAVAPGLSASQVRAILASSAKPFPAGSTCTTAICGAGIVNAAGAVQAAQAIDEQSTNFGGLWWNSPGGSEAGWGINFAHQGDQIFASWFTYDLNGKAWWLVMSANRIAHQVYRGTLFQGTGPSFDTVPFPPLGSPGRRSRLAGRRCHADVQRCEQRGVLLYGQRHRADQVDYARNLRAAADLPVRGAGQSGADQQLPGPVVGRAGSLGGGLGDQYRARGRHHFRDLVHLRQRRVPDVAGDDREQERIELVFRRPDPAHQWAAVQCGPVPADRKPGRRDRQCRRHGYAEFLRWQLGNLPLQRRRRRPDQGHHARSFHFAGHRLPLK